jgi:ubiquitin-protein ligase
MLQSSSMKAVTKELISLRANPIEDIQIILKDDNIVDIEAIIHGPGKKIIFMKAGSTFYFD